MRANSTLLLSILSFFILLSNVNSQTEYSMDFNGDDFYINFGDIDDFEGLEELSIALWINPVATGTGLGSEVVPVISKWFTSNLIPQNSYGVFLIDDSLQFNISDGVIVELNSFERMFDLNEWHYVVFTYNKGTIKYYLDGTLIDLVIGECRSINNCDEPFKIGDWYYEYNQEYKTYNGLLDEVSLWSKELNQHEIAQIMNCRPDPAENSLLGYWTFDDINGGFCADYSVNNNAGVYVNEAAWDSNTPDIDCTTSIKDRIKLSVSIFPNPTSDIVTITSAESIQSISIYTLDGRMVRQEVFVNGAEKMREMNLSGLPNGVYMVRVIGNEGAGIIKIVKE